MIFNKDSALVKNVWVPLILAGVYTEQQVPALGNLKEVVQQVLTEME
ncbi:MAG: hypothetical protein PWQ96_2446 [Clostridia bacterium]|nr:hypothetical protein [Clostridia bacterium]